MWVFSFGVKFSVWTGRKGPGFLILPLALGQILKFAGRRSLFFFSIVISIYLIQDFPGALRWRLAQKVSRLILAGAQGFRRLLR